MSNGNGNGDWKKAMGTEAARRVPELVIVVALVGAFGWWTDRQAERAERIADSVTSALGQVRETIERIEPCRCP